MKDGKIGSVEDIYLDEVMKIHPVQKNEEQGGDPEGYFCGRDPKGY